MSTAVIMPFMDVLARLETRIDTLLARLALLEEENRRLVSDASAFARDVENLTKEKLALLRALQNEKNLRENALARIDSLIDRVRAHGSTG